LAEFIQIFKPARNLRKSYLITVSKAEPRIIDKGFLQEFYIRMLLDYFYYLALALA